MEKLGYTTIQGWMYGLGLKLAETVCLAVIFGFSQDGESVYKGSRGYLAKKMCVKDTKTVDKALGSLIKKGYITKTPVERNGIRFAEYKVTPYCMELAVSKGCGKFPQGAETNHGHMEEKNLPKDGMDITNKRKSKECMCDTSIPFDLAKALASDLGVDSKVALDWVAVRKEQGIRETETAYHRIAVEIRKACEIRQISPTACVEYAVFRGWKTFEAAYEWPSLTNRGAAKPVEIL